MTKTKKIALCGVLTALALALSLAENAIPLGLLVPLPGVKLGLANVVTLICIFTIGAPYALAVSLARVFTVFLMTGNATALAMSLSGAMISLLAMVIAKNCNAFSIFGVSIIGAAMHNVGQITAACIIMHSVGIIFYLPILLITAIVTGILTATAAQFGIKAPRQTK